MKKYKLIETYPGSPKLGYIFNPDTIGDEKSTHALYTLYAFPNLVKNQPKYWEKVVEKDYEISCWSDPNNSLSHSLTDRGGWDINSVRRLRDNVIFAAGHFIKVPDIPEKCIIKEFELTDCGNLFVDYHYQDKNDGHLCTGDLFSLNVIEKYKEPLFTTEDGVDIFEGDKFWYFDKKIMGIKYIYYDIGGSPNKLSEKTWRFFSTKEAAEEYILMNKPCLSLNDVKKVFLSKRAEDEWFFSVLKKIIKSK